MSEPGVPTAGAVRLRADFGWGAAPFKEQFPALRAEDAELFDADNIAVIRLHVRGFLTDSQRDAAIKKITALLVKALPHPAAGEDGR